MGASADISRLIAGLGAYRAKGVAAAVRALDQFGEHTLANAQELCPVETGALQASATATRATLVGDTISKTIGFNTRYAAARHERPPEKDAPPRQNPRGQWKYLETAVREAAPKLGEFVARQVRAATNG